MDNYLTNIVGKGMIFPIQLTRNEKGETGWYPVNGDMALVRNNISSIMYYTGFPSNDFDRKTLGIAYGNV